MAAETIRAVGYIRTATTTQTVREHCTAAQAQRIRRYCAAHNIALVGAFADYGVGGNELERKGLRDALSLLKDGQADVFVTVNVSRLSRSVGALAKLVDAHFSTGEHGLVTLEEQIDTRTPCGHFILSLCHVLCKFEAETIGHA